MPNGFTLCRPGGSVSGNNAPNKFRRAVIVGDWEVALSNQLCLGDGPPPCGAAARPSRVMRQIPQETPARRHLRQMRQSLVQLQTRHLRQMRHKLSKSPTLVNRKTSPHCPAQFLHVFGAARRNRNPRKRLQTRRVNIEAGKERTRAANGWARIAKRKARPRTRTRAANMRRRQSMGNRKAIR